MQKTHGDRLDTLFADLPRYGSSVFPIDRSQDIPLKIASFFNFEDKITRDQGFGLPVFQVVHRVTRRATQFIDVAKSLGGDDGDPGAGPCQQGVKA